MISYTISKFYKSTIRLCVYIYMTDDIHMYIYYIKYAVYRNIYFEHRPCQTRSASRGPQYIHTCMHTYIHTIDMHMYTYTCT